MMIRHASTGIRARLLAVGVALALAGVGCSSDDGPEGSGSGPGGGAGSVTFEEDMDVGEEIAGRSAESAIQAQRLGLRTVYFDYDRSALREDAKDALRHNFEVLRKNPDVRVEIQGNCDERGSSEYNFALGERRAAAARDYLVRLGVPSSRITTVSFGEENPAVVGHTERAWAKNRRDDFAIVR